MIAKDEERFIAKCIESVRAIVDEIVVVDTGSTDATKKIAGNLGASVYNYAWDDNFSNARNYAISKAKSGWLLLLDADEELDRDGHDILLSYINTTPLDGAHFMVRNYTGKYSSQHYTTHIAMRLIKNNGRYHFEGEIHEQIACEDAEDIQQRFILLDVILHHYGYLDDVAAEKQKRKRNMPILEKQLEQTPTEPFILFNMGNEYLSMRDYKKALEYYGSSLENTGSRTAAFVPHLYFRMANAYENLGRYTDALKLLSQAIKDYPRCVDYQYARGCLLFRLRRYTLAIAALEKCLHAKPAPPALVFIPGCGTYRASHTLGNIYEELEDYQKALDCYNKALSYNPKYLSALYRAGSALNRMCADKSVAAKRIFEYFNNQENASNLIVGADILINEGLYGQALDALKDSHCAGYEEELSALRGSALFYCGRSGEAKSFLSKACLSPAAPKTWLLPNLLPQSAQLLLLCAFEEMNRDEIDAALQAATRVCSQPETAVCTLADQILSGSESADPGYLNEGICELDAIIGLLGMVLRGKRCLLFEKLLHLLNFVEAKNVMLRLAALYYENEYRDAALEYVLRSIRELDCLDACGALILFKQVVI